MDMPPIHMCFFLTHENERLKVKIVNLKRHITHLEQTIAERNLDHVHSCSISCQTDIDLRHSPRSNPLVKLPSHEQTRLHHLLKVQNDLLRKYENENQSSDRREFLSNGVINDYEQRLIRCEKEKQQAEQRAIAAEKRMEKFEERYQRMKQEIGSLDENFFEEIEDLKFALQQANNLNREYEKTVQILSNRLGIPYPTIANQRK
jgi:hypothetical protein